MTEETADQQLKPCPFCRPTDEKVYWHKCDICKGKFNSNRDFKTPICDYCDAASTDCGGSI